MGVSVINITINFVTAYHTHPGSAKSCGRKSYIFYLVRGHIDNSFTLYRISYVSLYTHISKTRMHLSRMRTTHYLLYRGVSVQGGLCQGTPPKEHGTRDRDPSWRNMGPETEIPQKEHGTRQPDKKLHHTKSPSPLWTEWQMRVKTLPYPKLRLRAINISYCS